MSIVAWTAVQAAKVLASAPAPASATETAARQRLEVLAQLSHLAVIREAALSRPQGDDVRALRSAGAPWRQLAEVVNTLRVVESSSLVDLARTLLAPDPEVRGRLFHLAVLGEVLVALEELGASIASTGPLGDSESTGEPAFVASLGDECWHLWFEAAGVWRALSKAQPYKAASEGVVGQSRALGADLMFVDKAAKRALVIECKFSDNPAVVGRDGYHQASTYLAEARGRLSEKVVSVVVAPTSMLTELRLVDLVGGKIGYAPPESLAGLIGDALHKIGPFANSTVSSPVQRT